LPWLTAETDAVQGVEVKTLRAAGNIILVDGKVNYCDI
jgi:hypothetical protein